MEVTMYDVGFGDCFLLCESHDMLLVDFGSRHGTSKLSKVTPWQSMKAGCRKAALITHFHADHVKGFRKYAEELPCFFDKVYVPYLLPNRRGEFVLVKMAILIYLFLKGNSLAFKNADAFLNQMEWLLAIARQPSSIRPMKAGREFWLGTHSFVTLWPDGGICDEMDGLTSFLEQMGSLDSGNLLDLQETILANFKEWSRLLDLGEGNNQDIESRLCEVMRNQKDCMNRLERLRSPGSGMPDALLNKLRFSGVAKFNDAINAFSVVFHSLEQHKASILMTGDVTKAVTEKYLSNRFYPSYRLLKVPHHGTKTFFSDKLPPANELLISTSKYGGYNPISQKYSSGCYANVLHNCTDGGRSCELVSRRTHCRRGSCTNASYATSV